MRRFTLMLFWVLGAGVLTTLCGAAVLAVSVNVLRTAPVVGRSVVGDTEWRVMRYDGFGATRLVSLQDYSPDVGQNHVKTTAGPAGVVVPAWLPLNPPPLVGTLVQRTDVVDFRGWPWPALWCQVAHVRLDPTAVPAEIRLGVEGGAGIPRADWLSTVPYLYRERVIPLRPIWSGVVLNSLVFATPFAMVMLLFELRRQVRLRSRRCARCGYPTAGSPVCTECGAAAPAMRSPTPNSALQPTCHGALQVTDISVEQHTQ